MNENQKSSYFVRKVTSKTAAPAVSVSKPAATNVLNIPGTKTSLQNNSLLTPIGVPSIDSFIGTRFAI